MHCDVKFVFEKLCYAKASQLRYIIKLRACNFIEASPVVNCSNFLEVVMQTMEDAPFPNFFSIRFFFRFITMRLTALQELILSTFLWLFVGRDYKETIESTLFRAMGLIVPGISDHGLTNYINIVRLGRLHSDSKYWTYRRSWSWIFTCSLRYFRRSSWQRIWLRSCEVELLYKVQNWLMQALATKCSRFLTIDPSHPHISTQRV